MRRGRPWRRWLLGTYLILLGASHVVRRTGNEQTTPRPGDRAVSVAAMRADGEADGAVRIAYADAGPEGDSARAVIVMLHGSPGDNGAFRGVGRRLEERFRVIAPDLPGFGASTLSVPDYSIRAHARYVLALLDSLRIRDAHFLGFSMGGGVVLNAYDIAPERVRSAILLSSIGVQELELMGDYHLNHAVHGLQLGGLWLLREAVPHFGAWDGGFLSVEYARNFYDSDQRPLRAILARFAPPLYIMHGDEDFLVYPEAAVEHHRLVPQADMTMLAGDHFMVFQRPEDIAPLVADWVDRVERGDAMFRAEAPADRLARAAAPFDPANIPAASGFVLVILILLIAAASFVSEDLACIGAGLMVARGTLGFWWATFACFVGLYLGDALLFLAGRWLGRPALRVAPLKWFVSERDVERSSGWFRKRGAAFVLASRFTPGTRLPTYFAAGTLHTNFWTFSLYFVVAGAIWTPLLVGASAVFGAQVYRYLSVFQSGAVWILLGAAGVLLVVTKLGLPLFSRRGRRALRGRLTRLTRWEFLPPWLFYLPVVGYILVLAVRFRGVSVFAAANPGMELGGFVGESKSAILRAVARVRPDVVPPTAVVAPGAGADTVTAFLAEHGLMFPVVVKPDVGERGRGVRIVRSEAEAAGVLDAAAGPQIVQAYVPGVEYGVLYYRRPGAASGQIFSITDKRLPAVTGDGRRPLEALILDHPRGVLSAKLFLRRHADRLTDVPPVGEQIPLVEVGTHCLGAMFLDGMALLTPDLEAAIDGIARGIEGFYFGRFDVRAPTADAFRAGRDLKVIELNGVTSEATHIYDPGLGLVGAYRTLFRQWRLVFEIGAANRDRGTPLAGTGALVRAAFRRFVPRRLTPASATAQSLSATS